MLNNYFLDSFHHKSKCQFTEAYQLINTQKFYTLIIENPMIIAIFQKVLKTIYVWNVLYL